MFDLTVVEFKEKIIEEINNSGMPLSIVHYVLKEVNDIVKDSLEDNIRKQKIEKEQKEQEELNDAQSDVIDVSGEEN